MESISNSVRKVNEVTQSANEIGRSVVKSIARNVGFDEAPAEKVEAEENMFQAAASVAKKVTMSVTRSVARVMEKEEEPPRDLTYYYIPKEEVEEGIIGTTKSITRSIVKSVGRIQEIGLPSIDEVIKDVTTPGNSRVQYIATALFVGFLAFVICATVVGVYNATPSKGFILMDQEKMDAHNYIVSTSYFDSSKVEWNMTGDEGPMLLFNTVDPSGYIPFWIRWKVQNYVGTNHTLEDLVGNETDFFVIGIHPENLFPIKVFSSAITNGHRKMEIGMDRLSELLMGFFEGSEA